jgi:hypothetical protein
MVAIMAQIDFQSVRTQAVEPEAAAEALVSGLGGATPKLVTVFASQGRDQLALNRALRERLPPATRLIGATTQGELDREGMHQGTVVLGALAGDFEVGLGLGRGLSRDAIAAGTDAMKQACDDLGVRPADLDRRRNVGLVIDDGTRGKKEELLIGMLAGSLDVTLVGGGAAGPAMDPSAGPGTIHVDGEVATDATLVALFRTDAPFAAMRSHWYSPTGDTVTVTKVDGTCMRALEIDGKPAAARYAELLGVGIDELEFGLPRGFAVRPTALRMGREYMLRAPWKPLPDGSILFVNLLEEGTELELMRLNDVVESTRRFFTEEIPARVAGPRAALLFHCTARVYFAHVTGKQTELFATLGAGPPCAGFNVSFEIYNGLMVNTTLTALVLGSSGAHP